METVQPSVFDRLTDPSLADGSRRYTILRAAERVQQDLADLLTSTPPRMGTFSGLLAVEQSIVNFGLPDVSHGLLDSPHARQEYREVIREVIETFEPRLTEVQVKLTEDESAESKPKTGRTSGKLHFRIHAKLNLYPDTVENVVFNTEINLSTGKHVVELAGDA